MDQLIPNFKSFTQNVEQLLREDFKSIRTGRATPGLIESLIVETYGGSTKMKLQEISTITTEGSMTLVVVPFDPSTSSDIEKAIQKSPLGLNPQPQGGRMLIHIPPMSQEQREKFTKLLSQKAEERRVMVRNERDNVRKKIKAMLDAKEVTEDQKFRLEKEIDTLTQNINNTIQTLKEHKEKEVMEV